MINLTGEQISPCNQGQTVEQVKFAYSPLGKQKLVKTIEDQDQGIKQDEAIKTLEPEDGQELQSIERHFPKKMRNKKIKNEIDEIKKQEEKNK